MFRIAARPALAVAVAFLFLIAGCSGTAPQHDGHGGASTPAARPGTFNAADVTFASEMIPHHRQAVRMSELAGDRGTDPALTRLAAGIAGAQQPEIDRMSGWLRSWGEPVPGMPGGNGPGGHGGHNGHGEHGGMPGMMTEHEMAGLERASGAAFDRMFAELMIRHHEGAIEMARTERAQGKHAAATALAGEIITVQQREIGQLRTLLRR